MVSVIFHSLLMYTLLVSTMLHSSLFPSGNSLSSLSVMCRMTSLFSVRETSESWVIFLLSIGDSVEATVCFQLKLAYFVSSVSSVMFLEHWSLHISLIFSLDPVGSHCFVRESTRYLLFSILWADKALL